MIETYLLEQFIAFARCGTLLKASEELHITQPTLSRSMKKLENELTVPIFQRENSKLSLNETGKLAVEYAEKALSANQDFIDHVLSFDRSLRTISIAACTPFPLNQLMPSFRDYFPDKTILTEIVSEDDKLLSGLKNHQYDLVILHTLPEDKAIFCQPYQEERIHLSVIENHPLAKRASVSFDEIKGLHILVFQGIGFWMDICKKHLLSSDLIVQKNMEALGELIEASSLPVFSSDRVIDLGYETPDRISIPIRDEDAHAVYRIACRASDQKKYHSILNLVRKSSLSQKNKKDF